ncbi:hypothetical protein BDR04DRAFT_1102344 [Suillus decipiens]|nr:hypothetical protein BDR04DRAFT_1102344 [Suillus decipiens]
MSESEESESCCHGQIKTKASWPHLNSIRCLPTFKSIYEFDASTLETVRAPFGHTKFVTSLALSFDGALLASAPLRDHTIKLWAFESRQLLASFDIQNVHHLTFSPDSCQICQPAGIYYILTQLVILPLGTADHQYLPYL